MADKRRTRKRDRGLGGPPLYVVAHVVADSRAVQRYDGDCAMSEGSTTTKPIPPCGVITLTTDLGHKGPYVASMKGVMLARFPQARIIDLTHDTLVHWPAEAGFWLRRSYRYFPAGTVHVAVVDPGVGTSRDIVLVEFDRHLFLAPDNGLLGALVEAGGDRCKIHRFDPHRTHNLGLPEPSATFHGRDIFAPLAADLASHKLRPSMIGPEAHEVVPSWVDAPERVGGAKTKVTGVVMTFDHFGNVITNIDGALLSDMDQAVVHIAGHRAPLRRTYADAKPGEYLALINAFGVVEVARAEESAAKGLGVERGAPVEVRPA